MTATHTPRRASRGHRAGGTLATRLVVTIVCAAGLIIALPGCGAANRDPRVAVLDRAAAADASLGVRYRFRSSFADKKASDRLRGYGQAEADQHRTRVVTIAPDLRIETIVDGHDEYSGGDAAAAGLLDSARNVRWTKLDRARFLDAGYIDKLCGADLPPKVAGVLADASPAIEKLGVARIGDVRTRRYRVTTTYGEILDVLAGDDDDDAEHCDKHVRAAKFVAELWIDRQDLIRRVRLRHRAADGLSVETRDITRYDPNVRVEVPTGPSVRDITDVLLKLADSLCKTTDDC